MKRITAILLCVLLCINIAACSRNSEDIGSSLSLVSTYENDQAETTGNSEANDSTTGSTTTTDSSVPDNTEADDCKVSETTGNSTGTTEPDTSVGTQTGTPITSDIRPSGGNTGTGSSKTENSKDTDTSENTKPPQTTTPPKTDATTESIPKEETKPTETTKPTEAEKPKDTTPPTEETKPEETTPPAETSKPTETEAPAETKPQEPSDPYAYPFNIEQIRQDCIALGKSYGFTLDESLTPNNSSWAGAETASSNTQGTRLKRLLTEMVEYYSPAYREDMGLPAVNITAFNIYCESTGNGTYRIYFLFLL